ncbi:hypothetical protein CR513_60674, partial [Mucuna pruriens]
MESAKRATRTATTFEKFILHHVPREQNDLLSKLSTTRKRGVQRSIIHESIGRSTIEEPDVGCMEERKTWMSPLMEYFRNELLLADATEARKIARDTARYIIIGGELYWRGFSFSLLWCIEGEEVQYVIIVIELFDCIQIHKCRMSTCSRQRLVRFGLGRGQTQTQQIRTDSVSDGRNGVGLTRPGL